MIDFFKGSWYIYYKDNPAKERDVMAAAAIRPGTSIDAYGSGAGSETSIQGTISRLEKERDKYQKEQESVQSSVLDKKIKNLEDRISRLQNRLDTLKAEEDDGRCETCENRKYQDGSNDPGVSFKTASKITGNAEGAVRAHEYEHVSRNQAKAEREGKEIVYQSVRIKHGTCPECGASYVSGGETVTVMRGKRDERFDVGMYDREKEKGRLLDIVA